MSHQSTLFRYRVPAYLAASVVLATIVQLIVKGGF